MATSGLYGSSPTGATVAAPGSESAGLYGNATTFGGSYFEWFIFIQSETQPATPTGGSWSFTTNSGTAPTGWSSVPPSAPTLPVWVSIALVNSKNTTALVWSAPGLFSYSSGLPILSGTGEPSPSDGLTNQLWIQTNTTPETIWFKQAGTWTRLTGSTLYADLTSNQTIAGTKTFSSQIQGSISGTSSNVTGIVGITNGGTGSTTANGALTALGGIGSLTSTDGSVTITSPTATSRDLSVATAASTTNVLCQVRNTTGATLTKGTVVYISGATGQIPTVSKALATSDATSAQTLGMISADLANNSNGYVTVIGLINDIDTSAYSDGAQLYLSGTTAGTVTATKPYAPIHLVYVAVVEYAHPTQGKLFVKVQNGYELDEIHNVSAQTPTNGQTIVYNSATGLWTQNTVSLTVGVNGTLPVANGGTGVTTSTGSGSVVLSTSPTLVTPALGTPTSGNFNTGTFTWPTFNQNTTGTASNVTGTVGIANGGTGQTTQAAAITALTGTQTNAYYLRSNGTNATLSALSAADLTGTVSIATGGTGQTTANAAFNALAPSQVGQSGKYLTTDGSNTSWATNPLGTVTSVGGTGTVSGITLSGTVTTSGNLTLGGTLDLSAYNGAGAFTTLSASSSVTLSGGTANGVTYLNGSKVLTSGSALQFDGTNLGLATTPSAWVSTRKVIELPGGALQTNSTTSIGYVTNAFNNGTNWLYKNDGTALFHFASNVSGQYVWQIAPYGTAGTAATFAQAMALDASSFLTVVGGATIQGLTVGRGAGAVATNTAVGASALAANTTGENLVAIGQQALASNTTGNFNVGVGFQAIVTNTIGSANVGLGDYSLVSNSIGSYNIGVGYQALYSNTTASNNTAVGYQAAFANTTGYSNTAIGQTALYSNTTGNSNTAVGLQSLNRNTTGLSNVATGLSALYWNTTGSYNVAMGESALVNNTTASYNTAVGYQAGYGNTTGQYSTMIGWAAGYTNTTGQITAVGAQALKNNTTGSSNTSVGVNSLLTNSTGNYNTALGESALQNNTTGSYSTVVGYQAAFSNNTGVSTTAFGYQAAYSSTSGTNDAFGESALKNTTTGGNNVAIGKNSVQLNTTGSNNTALGSAALFSNTTGSGSTAVGYQAGYSMTTNGYLVAFGYQAGYAASTDGCFIGYQTGYSTTTGGSNTAVGGYRTLFSNTTGSQNVAIGREALYSNTTASNNTAVGFDAGFNTTTGQQNSSLGAYALSANTTGQFNVAIGVQALNYSTTSSNNTAVGHQAGYNNTTGAGNVALGTQAGLAVTTGSYNTFLGAYAGQGAGSANLGTGNTAIGPSAGASLTTGTYNTFVGPAGQVNQGPGGLITTGSKNTILGGYNGNQGGVDIRTANNYIVLSDGDGNPVIFTKTGLTVALEGGNAYTGTGISFPATQKASSNANTLDDYEEGTWTPAILYGGITFSTISSATYTKIGRMVYVQLDATVSSNVNGNSFVITGQPFALTSNTFAGLSIGYNTGGTSAIVVVGSTGFEFYLPASSAAITNAQMSTSRLIVSGCYQTNT